MVNLAVFIRMVREAHGINQAELAKKIGVSQSAIAQFEKLKATLSLETLLKLAPILDLNPEFIQNGVGNPYKQTASNKIIKMYLPEDDLGNINFSLVKIIAEANETASFIFFEPPLFVSDQKANIVESTRKEIAQWHKQRKQDITIYALFVHDDDNNYFLFRRKNNLLFRKQDLITTLKEIELKDKKYFDIQVTWVNLFTCRKLREWHTLDDKQFINDMLKHEYKLDHALIQNIVNKIWSYKTLKPDREGYKNLKTKIEKMEKGKLGRQLDHLIPELAKVINSHFLID